MMMRMELEIAMDGMSYARLVLLNSMKEPVQSDADARFHDQVGALIGPLTIPER
jgi:hypothetical protein